MQTVSSTYRSIFEGPHTVISKAVINGVTYTESNIVSWKTSGSLFDGSPAVGSCVAARLDIIIRPKGETIPKMAEIKLFIQLTDGAQTSEWVPQGVFYIDTRKETLDTDGEKLLTVSGFDCILKLEQSYTPHAETGWPKTFKVCAEHIASLIGTTIDSRSGLSTVFSVQYDSTLTMRQYLGYIAAVQGGTWIATPDGELRLVSPFDIPGETNLLVNESGYAIVFGGTRILV